MTQWTTVFLYCFPWLLAPQQLLNPFKNLGRLCYRTASLLSSFCHWGCTRALMCPMKLSRTFHQLVVVGKALRQIGDWRTSLLSWLSRTFFGLEHNTRLTSKPVSLLPKPHRLFKTIIPHLKLLWNQISAMFCWAIQVSWFNISFLEFKWLNLLKLQNACLLPNSKWNLSSLSQMSFKGGKPYIFT